MVSQQSEIRPLKEYLGDKKEMVEIIFSCIEENQLKKMIPDVLKDAKIEDIKAECLVELLGMSKKRIMGIMEGKELDESSEDSLELSDISDDDTNIKTERESPEKYSSRKKDNKETKSKGGRRVSKVSSSDSDRDEDQVPSKKKKTKKKKEDSPVKEPPPKKTKNQAGKKNKSEVSKEAKEDDTTADFDLSLEIPEEKKGGKNLLEILELEMRARAIRSLIEREEKKNKDVAKEPKPSTSDQNTPVEHLDLVDNDPDAVIIIDETTDQIDLTKDESDSEEQSKSKKDKPTTSQQPRIYRNNIQNSTESALDKHKTKVVGNANLDSSETTSKDGTSSQVQKNETSEAFVPRNWTERWLDSNDVKKVMKTTKVLTNLKKRLINVNKQKSLEEKNNEEAVKEPTVIKGTVSEYSQLQKKINNTDKVSTNLTDCTDQHMNVDTSADNELTVETFISKDEMNIITEESENTSVDKAMNTSSETAESNDLQKSVENSTETVDDNAASVTDEDTIESNEKSKVLQLDCELIESESEKDESTEPEN